MSRRRLQITSVFIVFTFILFGFQNCSNKKTSFFALSSTGPSVLFIEKPERSSFQYAKFQFTHSKLAESTTVEKYECSLNGAEFKVCDSNVILDNNKDANVLAHSVSELKKTHSFRVRAMDNWGNWGPETEHKWEIDLSEFNLLITPKIAAEVKATNQEIVTLEVRFNQELQAGSKLKDNDIEIRSQFVSLVPGSIQQTKQFSNNLGIFEFKIKINPDQTGSALIFIKEGSLTSHISKLSSETNMTLNFDRKKPLLTELKLLEPTPFTIKNNIHYINQSLVKLKLSTDDGVKLVISESENNCIESSEWEDFESEPTFNLKTLNNVNPLKVSVKVKDQSGNVSDCSSINIVHDNIKPTLSNLTVNEKYITTKSLPEFIFDPAQDTNEIKTYKLSILNAATNTLLGDLSSEPVPQIANNLNQGVNTDGKYKIRIRAFDLAGNESLPLESSEWFRDRVAPSTPTQISALSVPLVLTEAPRIQWSDSQDGAVGSGIEKYQIKFVEKENESNIIIDWVDLNSGSAPQVLNNKKFYNLTEYKILVKAKDYAGNWSAEGTGAFTTVKLPHVMQAQSLYISKSLGESQILHEKNGKKIVFGKFVQYTNNKENVLTNLDGKVLAQNMVRVSSTGVLKAKGGFLDNYPKSDGNHRVDYEIVANDQITDQNIILQRIPGENDFFCDNDPNRGPTAQCYVTPLAQVSQNLTFSKAFRSIQGRIRKIVKFPNSQSYYILGQGLISHHAYASMSTGNMSNEQVVIKYDASSENADYQFRVDPTLVNSITDIAVDSQGRLILVGNFKQYRVPIAGTNNLSAPETVGHIVRLNTNGTIQSRFEGGLRDADASSTKFVVVDGNDNVYVSQTDYNGFVIAADSSSSRTLAKFKADGTPDRTYLSGSLSPSRTANEVQNPQGLYKDASHRIYLGRISILDVNRNITKYSLARLKADGSIDETFTCPKLNAAVKPVFLNSGIYLIGQFIYNHNSKLISNILKVDSSCSPTAQQPFGTGFSGPVTYLNEASNGDFIVAGQFDLYNQSVAAGIMRLNEDLTVDTSFNAGTAAMGFYGKSHIFSPQGYINQVVVDDNNKYYVAGNFLNFNGSEQKHLVKLNSNGSVDTSFSSPLSEAQIINSALAVKNNLIYTQVAGFGGIKRMSANGSGLIDFINKNWPIKNILVDSNQNVFVYGARFVKKLNSNGVELNEAGSLWTETVTENINKIIFDNSGSENLLICLQGSAGYWLTGNQSSAVAKLTNTGGRLSSFNAKYEVTSNCNDIAVDSRNRIVVSHSVENGGRSKNIIRYKENGVLDNSYSMANLNAEYYQFKGLGVDSKDNVLFWTDENHLVNNSQNEKAYYGPVLMVAP